VVTYYRGTRAHITHERFEVRHPTKRVFFLSELTRPRIVEEVTDPPALTAVRSGSTGMAGVAAVVVALDRAHDGAVFDSPLLAVGLLAVLLVSMLVIGACWRLRPFRYELVAVYRGRPVTLFRSADLREFGQVTRALARAIQQSEDTR
jgi:hypothetical protein